METAVHVVKCFVRKMGDRNRYFSLFPPTPLRDNLLPSELAEGQLLLVENLQVLLS